MRTTSESRYWWLCFPATKPRVRPAGLLIGPTDKLLSATFSDLRSPPAAGGNMVWAIACWPNGQGMPASRTAFFRSDSSLVSLTDRFLDHLSQVFRLRFFHAG